jgi:hypothetical protein
VGATAVFPFELLADEIERARKADVVAERETPAPVLVPGRPLEAVGAAALQRSAGNLAVYGLVSRTPAEGARALVPSPRRAAATAREPMIQRAPPKAPAAPAADEKTSDIVLKHLLQPLEFSVETKGPKPTGYVKINKASAKISVKISPSETTDGDVGAGAPVSGKTGDKNGVAIAIAAEAKQKTRTELNKQFDKGVSDLVKAVTDKDNALKTEFFGKAKAEAKAGSSGGKPEASTKLGFDVGMDATIFGGAKVTLQCKLTLIGLKAKKGEKGLEFEATAFSAEPSAKVSVKWKKAFESHKIPFDVEGGYEFGVEFEPNWAKFAADLAADVGAEAAITAAIDFAALAGPPLLAGFVLASGIVNAGEKGALMKNIGEAATDSHSAAAVFAQVMTGSDVPATGPRSKQAHDAAMNQIKSIAQSNGMEVEELMTGLRGKNGEYGRIYGQSRQQIHTAFDTEARNTVLAWRKEHYILAIWTREEDDLAAARAAYDPILSK